MGGDYAAWDSSVRLTSHAEWASGAHTTSITKHTRPLDPTWDPKDQKLLGLRI